MSSKSWDELLDKLGRFIIRELRHLSASNITEFIELGLINNKTISIIYILVFKAVNQQVIELIGLSSTENNTSILSKVGIVHQGLIELVVLLIKQDIIDSQNEVNFLLRIDEQYLKLVGLARSNLAESNRTSVIFAIKVV